MKKIIVLALTMMMFCVPASCDSTAEAAAYTETAVNVPSSTGEYEIPAILTVPESEDPVPLVVMHHGFGGNKNENHGFSYLAAELADNGIASIRMDFAGTGDSTVDFVNFSITEAVSDSNDCLAYALENANIDSEKLGILGYSNGGKVVSIITSEENNPYSVRVMLAPSTCNPTPDAEELLAIAEKDGYYTRPWFGAELHVGAQFYRDIIDMENNLDRYMVPSIPTLVIYGTEDTTVDPENSEKYAVSVNADVLRIYGGTHGFGFYGDDDASYAVMDTTIGSAASYFAKHLTSGNAKNLYQ